MTAKNKEAKKKYWEKFTPEQRSALLSLWRKKGWKRKSKEERLAHGKKLTAIRLAKKKIT